MDMTTLTSKAHAERLNLHRPSKVARFLSAATGEAIDTFDPRVSDFVAAAAPRIQELEAAQIGGLFRAAVRRAKPRDEKHGFEGTIHMAAPLPQLVEIDGEEPYWMVAIPAPNGFSLAYSSAGQFETRDDALAFAYRMMRADGWRESRAEAEADMQREIEYRSTHRRDGSLRPSRAENRTP